jgi:hypothetical protein
VRTFVFDGEKPFIIQNKTDTSRADDHELWPVVDEYLSRGC